MADTPLDRALGPHREIFDAFNLTEAIGETLRHHRAADTCVDYRDLHDRARSRDAFASPDERSHSPRRLSILRWGLATLAGILGCVAVVSMAAPILLVVGVPFTSLSALCTFDGYLEWRQAITPQVPSVLRREKDTDGTVIIPPRYQLFLAENDAARLTLTLRREKPHSHPHPQGLTDTTLWWVPADAPAAQIAALTEATRDLVEETLSEPARRDAYRYQEQARREHEEQGDVRRTQDETRRINAGLVETLNTHLGSDPKATKR